MNILTQQGALDCSQEYVQNYAIQKQRQKEDIEKWGHEDRGTYKGFSWHMKRCRYAFWCGYVNFELVDHDKALMEEIENHAHCGFTKSDEKTHIYGFDCGHCDDYVEDKNGRRLSFGNVTYRDHDYVLERIKAMIDCAIKQ